MLLMVTMSECFYTQRWGERPAVIENIGSMGITLILFEKYIYIQYTIHTKPKV